MTERGTQFATRLPVTELALRWERNWTAVCFFGALGLLHLSISVPSFIVGYWEGYLSLLLGTLFAAAAAGFVLVRCEMIVLPERREIRLRSGIGRLGLERRVGFESVRAVRLTLSDRSHHAGSRIELLCECEEIECPETRVPRQEALCLAIALGVRLIKVCNADPDDSPDRPL